MDAEKAMNEEHRERLIVKLKRELGTTILDALADDAVIEIMLNPDGKLWVEKFGVGKYHAGNLLPSQSESIVSTVAAMLGTTVGYDKPCLEGEFPLDLSRFSALAPPVVTSVSFTIRKKASRVFTLDDYLAAGILTQEQFDFIWLCCLNRKNIMVAGGTGSGKTTLLNAIIHAISILAPHDRLVVIEDTGELQCAAADYITMRAFSGFSMNQCLKSTMRFRPDRIIVGEVRGGEAMALLKSWNTGHEGGAGTLHANSGRLALSRLQSLIAEAPEASNYTPEMVSGLIGEAVNVVIFMSKDKEAKGGRTVKEIIAIDGFDAASGEYRVQTI